MFMKLLVLLSLMASTVFGTTFSNVQFETVSSNVNFISTRAITNQTAWIKSVLTNGAVGGSNVERLLVPAFEPNASVKLTNVNILAVFDDSATTNLTTLTYAQSFTNFYINEDVKHTSNFIVCTTNRLLGRFDTPTTGTKVEVGCYMLISNSIQVIKTINGVGTGEWDVVLYDTPWKDPYAYVLQTNTILTITGIYGLEFNSNNVTLGSTDGTNDSGWLIGNPWSDKALSYYGITPFFAPLDSITSEIFVAATTYHGFQAGQNFNPPDGTKIFSNYKNKWREYGNISYRINGEGRAYARIFTKNGTNFFVIPIRVVPSVWYYSTNKLQDINTYASIGALGNQAWTCADASPDGRIIYAVGSAIAAGGSQWYDTAGGSFNQTGMFPYVSFDYGQTFNAITNLGKAPWSSVYTSDGTNVYLGYSTTIIGGVLFSSNCGSNWVNTTLNSSTYGGQTVWMHITADNNSNIYVGARSARGSDNFNSSPGVYQGKIGSTNFTRIQNTLRIHTIIAHPTNTNIFWFSFDDMTQPSMVKMYKTTNRFANYFEFNQSETSTPKALDFTSIDFAKTDPSIGYLSYDLQYYITGSGRVLRTSNNGTSWAMSFTNNARLASIATYDGTTVYAAVSTKPTPDSAGIVYLSTNSGTTWTPLTNQLASWVKLIMPTSNKVYGLVGFGQWALDTIDSTQSSLILELDTTQNIFKVLGGRLDGLPQYTHSILRSKDGTNFYTIYGATYGGSGDGTLLISTNGGNTFTMAPWFNANGSGALSAGATVRTLSWVEPIQNNENLGYICGWNTGTARTTNKFNSLTSSDSALVTSYQLWSSPDGRIIHKALMGTTISSSTNFGTNWYTSVTNVARWSGITSYDGGNTIIVATDNSRMSVFTNVAAGITSRVPIVLSSSPSSRIYLNAISTNMIFAFPGSTGGRFYSSTNQGTNWSEIIISSLTNLISVPNISWVEVDPRDPTTNSFWISIQNNRMYPTLDIPTFYYTTNFFLTIAPWSTNGFMQSFRGMMLSSFDISKTDSNKVVILPTTTGSIFPIPIRSTNWFKQNSFIPEDFLQAISGKRWTGITTYDGDNVYAVAGLFGATSGSEFAYKIDFKNKNWTYLNNWRNNTWTDINQPNPKEIYLTSRSEIHKYDLLLAPTNYFTITTDITATNLNSSNWINIQDTLATLNTYTDSFGETYFTFSFDNNKSYVKWESANWRAVVTNDSGWKYWNGSAYIDAYTNSITAALSDAMQYTTNQMNYTQATGISPTNWIGFLGFNTNLTSNIYVGVTMRSQSNEVPNIQNLSFDYSAEGDNFRKKNAVTDGYKIEYEPTNGVYTIRRTGVTTDTYIYYIRK